MKITPFQLTNITLCFLLNMLDGMDVMVVSYAAKSISAGWSINPKSLGIVLSSGLVGMTIGAMFIAPLADKLGRKTIILLCVLLMGTTVFATAWAGSVNALILFRVISGIGIGGVLASSATLAAEYAPKPTKDFWVSFAMSGYPIGAVLSGLAAGSIIPAYGWPTMFKIAGIATLIVLPVIYLFLKESAEFLNKQKSKNKPSVKVLLQPEFGKQTIGLWLALFMAFASLYFLTLWIPKLSTDAGLSEKLGIYAGTVFNMGAFFGIMTQGYLSSKFGLQKTIFWFLVFTAVLMLLFGLFRGSDYVLLIFGLLGYGIQGGFVGMYSLAAKMYPVEIRATGVGWAIGMGRIGGIAGPVAGGLLIGWGLSMTTNFIVFAIPTIIAGLATIFIRLKKD